MIPPHFRKLPLFHRQRLVSELFKLTKEETETLSNQLDLSELTDILVESAIGSLPIPLGLATGFVLDRRGLLIPMATEEPSVIAGASFAARLCKGGGGFRTWADDPIMTTQIFLKECAPEALSKLEDQRPSIQQQVDAFIPRMVERGGGFRGMEIETVEGVLIVSLHVDVRDAMGANVMNTLAEGMQEVLCRWSGGKTLMAILTNSAEGRKAGASFDVPVRFFRRGAFSGEEVCERIVAANQVAETYPKRAVTHNKGIMNGISALALATGNDTRAVEAGAHFYAQKTGQYKPLTRYTLEDGNLKGSIELPLAMGTVGGTVGVWPPSRLALKILGQPNSPALNRIGAALGLAQNLAALFALVTEGIQAGHMKLHSAREGLHL